MFTLKISLLFCLVTYVNCAVTCMDRKGKPVDWFIIYKLPRLSHNTSPWVAEGLGHFYMDAHAQYWTQSDAPLNETQHAVYYTLQQIYGKSRSQTLAYAMYNDEKPHGPYTVAEGHTKGTLSLDEVSGFWLVHSLPHFPDYANTSYSYPHTGLRYGQTFICVTYPFKTFNTIGKQLQFNDPWIYDSYISGDFASSLPDLAAAFKGVHVTSSPFNHSVELQSVAGQSFTVFSKASKFNADIFHDWLAPYFGSDLYSETWQNGVGKLISDCSGSYSVKNIKWLRFATVWFKETLDHAKWAVTVSPGRHWVCIGDINRAEDQERRGGGFVCFNLPKVWTAFRNIVSSVENCEDLHRIRIV